MSDETEVLESQAAQREDAKRASFELFKSKRRAQQEFVFKMNTPEGEVSASMLFRALSGKEWDSLVMQHPPKDSQKAEGATYNSDTFCPALLSRVCIEPVMNISQWTEIWNSEEWNKGELSEMFWTAVGLCNRGLDVNPTEPV